MMSTPAMAILAEAIPAPAFGEAFAMAVVAAALVFWLFRKIIKIAVLVIMLMVIGAALTSLHDREAPAWVSTRPSSKVLARAMEKEGIRRPPDACAHHIVAGTARRADVARQVLFSQHIDINDPANGVFLDCPYHHSLHTNPYYLEVNRRVTAAPPGRVRDVLRVIAAQLLSRTFPH